MIHNIVILDTSEIKAIHSKCRNIVKMFKGKRSTRAELRSKSLERDNENLQPLDDVPVISRRRHHRVPAGGVPRRQTPAHGRLLDDVVGLHKQVVDLIVQVHGDGDGSAFSCRKHTQSFCGAGGFSVEVV